MKKIILIMPLLYSVITVSSDNATTDLLQTVATYDILTTQTKLHPTSSTGSPDHNIDHDAPPPPSEEFQQAQTMLEKIIFVPTLDPKKFIITLKDEPNANQEKILRTITATQGIINILIKKEPQAQLKKPQAQLKVNLQTSYDPIDYSVTELATMFQNSQPVNLSQQEQAFSAIKISLGNLTISDHLQLIIPTTPAGLTLTSGKISKDSAEKIIEEIEKGQNLGILFITLNDSRTISLNELKALIASATYSAPATPPAIDPTNLQYSSRDEATTSPQGLIVTNNILRALVCTSPKNLPLPTGISCSPAEFPESKYNAETRVTLWQRYLNQDALKLTEARYKLQIPAKLGPNTLVAIAASSDIRSKTITLQSIDGLNLGTCFDIMELQFNYKNVYSDASFTQDRFLSNIKTSVSITASSNIDNAQEIFKWSVRGYIQAYCKYYRNGVWSYYIRSRADHYNDAQKLNLSENGRAFIALLTQAQQIWGDITIPLNRENKDNAGIAERNENVTLSQIISYINA